MKSYFKNLYRRTMDQAYAKAYEEIYSQVKKGGDVLDCGAYEGADYTKLAEFAGLEVDRYFGIEWSPDPVLRAQESGLRLIQGDLNTALPYSDSSFSCIYGLSVLEHLLKPCYFLKECHRCLQDDGVLVILTPNISTLFTIALLVVGKMPSSGPHPDSDALIKAEEVFKVSQENLKTDAESDTPVHRHLIIFSFRVLRRYLEQIGFRDVRGFGFGLYPFPNFMQKPLERVDPYHCHQMVFIARK